MRFEQNLGLDDELRVEFADTMQSMGKSIINVYPYHTIRRLNGVLVQRHWPFSPGRPR